MYLQLVSNGDNLSKFNLVLQSRCYDENDSTLYDFLGPRSTLNCIPSIKTRRLILLLPNMCSIGVGVWWDVWWGCGGMCGGGVVVIR